MQSIFCEVLTYMESGWTFKKYSGIPLFYVDSLLGKEVEP
ncbi:hypothetical protein BH18THE2_BH18THE2_06790 [soil metagenome]